MLALTFFRYWWLRPRVQDPQSMVVETSDENKKSISMTSIMEPLSAPQFETVQTWTKICYGTLDSVKGSVIEIEKALVKGKDMILVEPSIAGQVYTHYISHGWLLQENTVYYGSLGLFFSYFFPKRWLIYIPCSLLALIHSWMYFKVYKHDRLSQYQAYDDDRHPVSNLITAWVMGQRPDHFQYLLKKERVIVWEIISQLTMYTSVFSCLVSLKSIAGTATADRFVYNVQSPIPLLELLSLPAYFSGYFQPPELVPTASGTFLPADIPHVKGWFDLPWFNLRFKPMKLDLAIIICTMGGYFVFKTFEHFFGYKEGDEVDGARNEWLADESIAPTCTQTKNPYWVEATTGVDGNELLLETGMWTTRSNRVRTTLEIQEAKTIGQISGQVPYGWERPGYTENHHGIFT